MLKRTLLLLTCLVLVACQKSSENAEIYKAAYEKQKETIAVITETNKAIANDTTDLAVQLKEEVHELEESLFEIPGYHLELPGHEGHSHSHNSVDLTAEEMLAVQEELLEQAKALYNSILSMEQPELR